MTTYHLNTALERDPRVRIVRDSPPFRISLEGELYGYQSQISGQDPEVRRCQKRRREQSLRPTGYAGQVQDEKLQVTFNRLVGEYNDDHQAGYYQGRDDGEEWAHSASLRDLRRVCEANKQEIDTDELLEMLARYWNPQDLNDLGNDYDRPSFMSGYECGFPQERWRFGRTS